MRLRPFVLIAFAATTASLDAQTGPAQRQAPATRIVKTMKAYRATSSLRIDGKLDEPAWSVAPAASDFTQSYPNVGAAPTERTEFRVLYDDAALYVGVRMFDSHPDSIAAQLARRDASGIYSDGFIL